jgi:hypothetical protein
MSIQFQSDKNVLNYLLIITANITQGVSGEIVNILGAGSMDYSE